MKERTDPPAQSPSIPLSSATSRTAQLRLRRTRPEKDRPFLHGSQPADSAQKTPIRCAIYTRVSSDDGLKQDFNSLDAQRESAESFIAAFKHEGWVCLPDHYDDGGFSGGNMERPALTRLLADVGAGSVDCIVVYKLDRLSRSIVDFGRLVEMLQTQGVDFRSVTEPVDTATATGRLVLNTLMSFAQHYREQIAERTRDKMRASRRKGKWVGGTQMLGYDVAPEGGRLIVNDIEAARVRNIYQLYLDRQATIATVEELNQRGWTTKQWTTRDGRLHAGKPFDKNRLRRLLTNPTYIGKIHHQGQMYAGEQEAIIDEAVWLKVQKLLGRNAKTGGNPNLNKHGALLKGLLRCAPCNAAMVHTFSRKGPNRLYRYYTCHRAQKQGWASCPTKAVPAAEMEQFVVDHIRGIGRDPDVLASVLRQTQAHSDEQLSLLRRERQGLLRDLRSLQRDVTTVRTSRKRSDMEEVVAERIVDIQNRITEAENRVSAIEQEIRTIAQQRVEPEDLRAALTSFDPVWDSLKPAEQTSIIALLIAAVSFDGGSGRLAITFHASGIRTLAEESRTAQEVPA